MNSALEKSRTERPVSFPEEESQSPVGEGVTQTTIMTHWERVPGCCWETVGISRSQGAHHRSIAAAFSLFQSKALSSWVSQIFFLINLDSDNYLKAYLSLLCKQ